MRKAAFTSQPSTSKRGRSVKSESISVGQQTRISKRFFRIPFLAIGVQFEYGNIHPDNVLRGLVERLSLTSSSSPTFAPAWQAALEGTQFLNRHRLLVALEDDKGAILCQRELAFASMFLLHPSKFDTAPEIALSGWYRAEGLTGITDYGLSNRTRALAMMELKELNKTCIRSLVDELSGASAAIISPAHPKPAPVPQLANLTIIHGKATGFQDKQTSTDAGQILEEMVPNETSYCLYGAVREVTLTKMTLPTIIYVSQVIPCQGIDRTITNKDTGQACTIHVTLTVLYVALGFVSPAEPALFSQS
ncbi:hypothetical protein CcaverHIS641_0608750 [Cutaneotrichosporon cavernicola]|nr:hypothetical protein CcaverHIS641_0608750 [Cutaneotrichosporon cavernicola]